MTRVTFREGDIVVPHVPPMAGSECTVSAISGREALVGSHWHRFGDLRLLRRPVRVGDELRSSGTQRVLLVSEVSRTGVAFACGDSHSMLFEALYPANQYGWTHADGTPIEPPKAVEKSARRIEREMAIVKAVWGKPEPEPVMVPVPPLPRTEDLARAVFETDPRVMSFVDRVADWTAPGQRHCSMRCEDDPNWKRAMQTAWERNERGWADDAVDRASGILAVLLQSVATGEK